LQAGLKDAALGHLRRFTVAAGKDLASLVKAAEYHLELNRLEDAFELANRSREVDFQARAQRVLGLVHFAKNDYAQAAFHLDRCDLDAKALAALLHAQLRIGDLDAANRRLETSRKLSDATMELQTLTKDITALVTNRDQALEQWNVPKEQRSAARRSLNRCLIADHGLAQRWPREIIANLLADLKTDGLEYAPLLALRSLMLLERGQLRAAIGEADAALKLRPTDARAMLVRGRARLEQANVKAALSDLRRATELSKSEDPIVLHWFAAALLEAGRTKEAVETQRLATLLRPNDAELQEQLRRMEMVQAKETSGGSR
jgi:tetratricopeptide (TPR) repeat protein